MKNAIVYAVDDNFKSNKFLENSIYTLLKNTTDIDVFGLTLKNNIYFPSIPVIQRINVDDIFYKYIENLPFKQKQEISKFTFVRLIIPLINELDNYNRVLYLDTDVEVVSDISDIFISNIDNCEIGAVEESLPTVHYEQLNNDLKKLSFTPIFKYLRIDKYFNAGVLLMNLDKIRSTKNYRERFVELIKIHSICNFKNHDQDLINISFDIISLHKKYNVFPDELNVVKPSIIHYICHYKKILENKI